MKQVWSEAALGLVPSIEEMPEPGEIEIREVSKWFIISDESTTATT